MRDKLVRHDGQVRLPKDGERVSQSVGHAHLTIGDMFEAAYEGTAVRTAVRRHGNPAIIRFCDNAYYSCEVTTAPMTCRRRRSPMEWTIHRPNITVQAAIKKPTALLRYTSVVSSSFVTWEMNRNM